MRKSLSISGMIGTSLICQLIDRKPIKKSHPLWYSVENFTFEISNKARTSLLLFLFSTALEILASAVRQEKETQMSVVRQEKETQDIRFARE